MTKDNFLNAIQEYAKLTAEGSEAWALAIKQEKKDSRWKAVAYHPHESILIQNFKKAFGL